MKVYILSGGWIEDHTAMPTTIHESVWNDKEDAEEAMSKLPTWHYGYGQAITYSIKEIEVLTSIDELEIFDNPEPPQEDEVNLDCPECGCNPCICQYLNETDDYERDHCNICGAHKSICKCIFD